MFCIDFAPTDHLRLEHDLMYYFCYICSLGDKGIHTDCPQYFSVSVQSISSLTVQCTCFDNLPLEVNGACEFPDGCGKEGCVVSRLLYWQSDETFYWFLILRFQFTIHYHVICFHWSLGFTQHHWWILKILCHLYLIVSKNQYSTRILIDCMKVGGGNLAILKLVILLRSEPFWS